MPIQILYEIKVGVPPDSPLFSNFPGEYWLIDENGVIATTGYSLPLPGNHWEIDGATLQINTAGLTSRHWELDGTTLQAKI